MEMMSHPHLPSTFPIPPASPMLSITTNLRLTPPTPLRSNLQGNASEFASSFCEVAKTADDFLMDTVNDGHLIREVNELMQIFVFNSTMTLSRASSGPCLLKKTDIRGSDKMEYCDEQRKLLAEFNDLREFAIRRADRKSVV